jgi:anti-sigma B factor antagonist
MNAHFQAEIEELEGLSAVLVSGELDKATVPELRGILDRLIGAGSGAVLVDLSACEFIDSSGLAALVQARERLLGVDGRPFAICCPDTQVRRLLEITGLDEAMSVSGSRDEAIASLRAT